MKIIHFSIKVLTFLLLLLIGGCNISDDYSDCRQDVIFKLHYTHNQEDRDKFDEQVQSVDLFIYDRDGNLVSQTRHAPATGTITVNDLPANQYESVFWVNYTDNYFTIEGTNHLDTHTLTFIRHNSDDIFNGSLFHSAVTFGSRNDQVTEVEVPLIKNTNNVNITLTGAVSPDHRVTISGSNADYRYDNTLVVPQPLIGYLPHQITGTTERTFKMNIMRMFFGDDLQINIFNGSTLIKTIPLVETLAAHSPLLQTDSDLDRYDTYALTYDIDLNSTCILTFIQINDWQQIIQNGGIH